MGALARRRAGRRKVEKGIERNALLKRSNFYQVHLNLEEALQTGVLKRQAGYRAWFAFPLP